MKTEFSMKAIHWCAKIAQSLQNVIRQLFALGFCIFIQMSECI